MSRTSRLLLAPAAALALLALSPGTASADPLPPDPTGLLRTITDSVTGGLTGAVPDAGGGQQAAPAEAGGTHPGAALPDALGEAGEALTGGAPAGGEDDSGTGTGGAQAEDAGGTAGDPAADEPAPNPVAGLCDQLRDGLGLLSPELAEGIDVLCEAAEADPTAAIQDLLEGLLAQLPTDPAAGCQALLDAIDQGADALGVDAAPLRGLIEQLCALVPGEPAPAPAPGQPAQPAQPVHPVVQPQQHPQPAVVPVSSGGGTGGGGQLAYTGVEPRPYLAAGVGALGLGYALQRLGRRRDA